MPNAMVGALSSYAIGVEVSEGHPVYAQHMLGVSSSTLEAYAAVIPIAEDTGIRNDRAAVWGASYGSGAWTMYVRHDKFTRVLQAHFGSPATTLTGPYQHVFKTKQLVAGLDKSHTLWQNRGMGVIEVYPGAFCNALTLAASRDARVLTATANWMTRSPYIYDYDTDGVSYTKDDSAAYDADNPWVWDLGTFTLHSTANTTCRSFNITRSWDMQFEDNIVPTRGTQGVTYGMASVTGSIELTYSSEAEFKRFFAGAASPSDPYKVGQAVLVGTVKFDFAATGETYAGEHFTIEIDEAVWQTVGRPMATRGALVQRCDLIGFYDATDLAEMKLTVINSESSTTTAGTAMGVLPSGG